jgi:hypothetical protein
MERATLNRIVKALTAAEGKKSQVRRSDMAETVACLVELCAREIADPAIEGAATPVDDLFRSSTLSALATAIQKRSLSLRKRRGKGPRSGAV